MHADRSTTEAGAAPLKRTGTIFNARTKDDPKTLGARLAALRLLHPELSQGKMADLLRITHKSGSSKVMRKLGDSRPMARTTYLALEHDRVEPAIETVEQMAAILNTTPEYLLWGRGPRQVVPEYVYNGKTDEWDRTDSAWGMSADWVAQNYTFSPNEVAIVLIGDDTGKLAGGDAAIVHRDEAPTAQGAEFIYGCEEGTGRNKATMVRCAKITRPTVAGPYRVFSKSGKEHIDFEPGEINILGRVVGKITAAL